MEITSTRTQTHAVRLITATLVVAITLTLVAAVLPVVTAQAATPEATFRSRLAAGEPVAKFTPAASPAVAAASTARTETYIAPPAPATRTVARRSTSTGSASTGTSVSSSGESAADAQSILAGYIAKYPILAGSTVSYGDAKGSQAIAYYKSGRIVISPDHTASLSRIIAHEIWHIIDWRDNGVIDWGENVPPK